MVVCSIATSTTNTTIEWSAPLHNFHINSLHSITWGGSDTAYSTSHDGLLHCYVHYYHSITWGGSDTAYATPLFVNTNTQTKDVMQDSPDEPFPLLTIWQQLGK